MRGDKSFLLLFCKKEGLPCLLLKVTKPPARKHHSLARTVQDSHLRRALHKTSDARDRHPGTAAFGLQCRAGLRRHGQQELVIVATRKAHFQPTSGARGPARAARPPPGPRRPAPPRAPGGRNPARARRTHPSRHAPGRPAPGPAGGAAGGSGRPACRPGRPAPRAGPAARAPRRRCSRSPKGRRPPGRPLRSKACPGATCPITVADSETGPGVCVVSPPSSVMPNAA